MRRKSAFLEALDKCPRVTVKPKTDKMKTGIFVTLLYVAFYGAIIFGEVRCIYKAIKCNWEPIGKAEVIYTAAAFTGLGCIVGYFDIEDK